jgi:hypothetical protein
MLNATNSSVTSIWWRSCLFDGLNRNTYKNHPLSCQKFLTDKLYRINLAAGCYRTHKCSCARHWSGADPGFQVRGGALKKIAPSGGRREHFWSISCEKSPWIRPWWLQRWWGMLHSFDGMSYDWRYSCDYNVEQQ